MQFILHRSDEGRLTLYPNKTNTPKELLANSEEIDIPTDKDGLMGFINEILEKIPLEETDYIDPIDPIYEGKSDVMSQIAKEKDLPIVDLPLSHAAVEDYIFDKATPAQVENIFRAIGTRFHEMRKSLGQ